jgi:hypothetical protein
MATVNKDFRVKHGLVVEGSTGTLGGNNILTDADTIDALGEGTTNLFYTDQKVKDVLTSSTQTNISITEEDGVLTIAAESGIEDATTDDLDEGSTNLYFTDQRAQDAVTENLTTDDLDEGSTNLYFTDQRAQDAVTETLTTDDLDEGSTNLYFTDQRARDVISGTDGISYDSETGSVSVNAGYGLVVGEENELEVDTDEIATRAYADAISEGLHIHASVSAATTENITLSPAPATIDGITLVEGMRVLIKDQTTKSQNGIYVLDEQGDLVRAEDYDTAEEIQAGDFVFVTGGTSYNATGWVQLNNVNTLGTDPLDWTQFIGAGTFTGGDGIDIDGQEISIDFTEFDTDDIDEGSTNLYYTDTRVKDVLTGATKENISITVEDGVLTIAAESGIEDATTDDLDEGSTNLYFTDQRAQDAVTENLTTDDLDEGSTNLYFTDQRAQDAVTETLTTDDLDEGSTNLYFTDQRAQDAVTENLTTDDLDEGSTNLYFTDQRAVDALEAVVPDFEAVEINSIAKQIAATATLPTAEVVGTVYSFDHAEYRAGKFLVKMAFGNHTEVVEVLLTLDSSNNIAITQYAMVGTNGELGAIDAVVGGTENGEVLLRVEPNNNSTVVNVYGTLLV